MFRQEEDTKTLSNGGMGIGLWLVRHLVDLHGGRVAAESDGRGMGSTFTITLPLA
jgi:two-component system CheB/CheR fusion protein